MRGEKFQKLQYDPPELSTKSTLKSIIDRGTPINFGKFEKPISPFNPTHSLIFAISKLIQISVNHFSDAMQG